MKMLNFACGARIHTDWENIDFSPIDARVKKVNLLGRLPYPDNYFDCAYSSHFLEHLTPAHAHNILTEIKRVLKPHAILRIVVPDLENLCRAYLETLERLCLAVKAGGVEPTQLEFQHHWLMIELLDQMTRVKSGGEMLKCFMAIQQTQNIQYAQYIKTRVGEDLLAPHQSTRVPITKKITFDKISNKILGYYLKFLRLCVPRSLRDEVFISTSIGERHKWMYDRFSLPKLLQEIGFINTQVLDYQTSQIKDFGIYYLDSNPDNTPYKGASSIYVESQKP